jgi:hypothetical protein
VQNDVVTLARVDMRIHTLCSTVYRVATTLLDQQVLLHACCRYPLAHSVDVCHRPRDINRYSDIAPSYSRCSQQDDGSCPEVKYTSAEANCNLTNEVPGVAYALANRDRRERHELVKKIGKYLKII